MSSEGFLQPSYAGSVSGSPTRPNNDYIRFTLVQLGKIGKSSYGNAFLKTQDSRLKTHDSLATLTQKWVVTIIPGRARMAPSAGFPEPAADSQE
jgi:hypothetical protein